LAVYKPSDKQVCVVWQYHSEGSARRRLGFRCYKSSSSCSDPCCCQYERHCDACGLQMCDINAKCTEKKQCECRKDLGFFGNGSHCSFDPCTAGHHNCRINEQCKATGVAFICVCKPGYKRQGSSCVLSDPCAPGFHNCDVNAFCQRRRDMTYSCHCYSGYIGNGRVCLDVSQCHKDATAHNGRCLCNRGFVGNGAFCCPIKFPNRQAVVGGSVTLTLDTSCLGRFVELARFQWFHKHSATPIDPARDRSYTLGKNKTELVINSVSTKQLGDYAVLFYVDRHGPYEVSSTVYIQQQVGCGRSGRKDPRISKPGSEATYPGEFPWQAMLCGARGKFCGGVLISKCCIVTAAHCVSGSHGRHHFDTSILKSLRICVGRRCGDCEKGSGGDSSQCFSAHSIHVHQRYNEKTFEHDIAIIRLKSGHCVEYRSASALPVCLPQEPTIPGKTALVIGWGQKKEGGNMSSCLRKGKTKTVEHGQCRSLFAEGDNFDVVTKDQMCAEDEIGPCQGDSGGPLLVKNAQNRFAVAGLVSWGKGCGRKNTYGVYTDVEHHLDWIYQTCSDFSS
jgi:hypothetical protein